MRPIAVVNSHRLIHEVQPGRRTDPDPAPLVAGKYGIEDLVDLAALERLFKKFSVATGFTVGLFAYPSQKILIKTGWRDACVKFHRACPAAEVLCHASNADLSLHLQQHRELTIRQCRLGLMDGATPILVRGAYLAFLSTGQVFFQPPDLDHYRIIARQFGFDAAKYLPAIQAVPVVAEARFREVLSYLGELATLVAEQGLLRLEKHEQYVQLCDSMEQFRDLFESSRDAIMTLEPPSWKFTAGNPATVRMFGAKTAAEFVACAPWELSPARQPDGRASGEKALEMIATALRHGSHFFEWTHRRLSGEEFQADVLLTKMERAGKVVVQATVRDITDRKQAEAQLRSVKEEWERTFDAVPDLISIIDTKYTIRRANRAMAAKLGVTPEQAVGLTCYQCVHGLQSPPDSCPHNKLLRDQREHTAEVHEDRLGGDFLVTCTPLLGPDRKLLGSVHVARDITARKQAEAALRQSEERYRTLFTTMIEGFAVIEVLFDAHNRPVDYRFLEVNPAFEAQTGLRNAQGKWMHDLAPAHEADWFEIYGKVAMTGHPAHFVHEAKTLNRWFDVSAYRLGGPHSRKVGILLTDITERKMSEARLEYLASFPVRSPKPILEVDLHGHINYANPAALRLFPDLERNRQAHPLLEDWTKVTQSFRAGQTETCHRVVTVGDRCYQQALYYFPADQFVRIYNFDITEQKRAEDALHESVQQFRVLFEQASDGMLLVDVPTKRFLLANRQIQKWLGYSAAELRQLVVADIHPAAARGRVSATFARQSRGELTLAINLPVLRKDGTVFYADVSTAPFTLQGRRCLLGIFRDVAERNRLEAEIQHISEVEKQRLGQDLHDGLTQQLIGVRYLASALEAALTKQALPEAGVAARIGFELLNAAEQTRNIARGLFPIKLKNGGFVLALQELAATTAMMFKINCRVVMPRDIRFAEPETARQLYRIAQEAINNAVKHGHGQHVRIKLVNQHGRIILTVQDDGVGIAAKIPDRTGMGLHIMQYRADIINAVLTIARAPRGGTRVTCTLPSRPRLVRRSANPVTTGTIVPLPDAGSGHDRRSIAA